MSALCAEIAQFFKESGRIAGETGLGTAAEVSVAAEEGTILATRVTDDYILLLVAGPDAIPGKCRFRLRQSARRAKEML
jgi:predicted regulator of Ras-like GTPase activity (Roadblock/LC7/MglB family)